MYIARFGQAVLELLSFKVVSGNHQRGISLLQKFTENFSENSSTQYIDYVEVLSISLDLSTIYFAHFSGC